MILREKNHNDSQLAWNKLDSKRKGYFEVDDIKNLLTSFGVYITKPELNYAYHFLDDDNSNRVGFIEFIDFWNSASNTLITLNQNFDTARESSGGGFNKIF